jgi:predicted PhzF superfamily epimerase YddE/YHI9
VPEDPVTGSAHCLLVPYWAGRLGRRELAARQISPRGGSLACRLDGDRVEMAGRAIEYLRGTITV